jgi:CPA2 family monovalent cation:H+ antiporter-2
LLVVHGADEALRAVALVFCIAAITTALFLRLRLPIVLAYIVAGVIIGPYVPFPLVASSETVGVLSELGVILLMFALGLEFSLGKLLRVGPTAAVTAIVQSSIMLWLGYLVGRAFGWRPLESVFAGAIVAISSTTIIAKVFEEQHIEGKLRELVVGVLIVEDLIAVMLMAVLIAVSSGGMSAGTLGRAAGRMLLFLAAMVVGGLLLVPRVLRVVDRLRRPEATLVASMAICFGAALFAQELGYSVALGAFLAGSLVAESGGARSIEPLVVPVRDLFGAVFFVSVGMLIDPAELAHHWAAVLVFTALVIGGKVFAVTLGAFLTGNGTRTSVQAGLSLAQIGEFSFIIAGLGTSLEATRGFLYPIAVAVSCLTTLTTPLSVRWAGPLAAWIDRSLPRPIQTFATLYGTWLERLRAAPAEGAAASRARRLAKLLFVDAALVIGLVVATSVLLPRIERWASTTLGISAEITRWSVILCCALLAVPLVVGIFRLARELGLVLAKAALPLSPSGQADLGAAPRRALLVALQIAVFLVVGMPVLAVLEPFLPGWASALIPGVFVVSAGVLFWRSASNLEEHVEAGVQIIVGALAAQRHPGSLSEEEQVLEVIRERLPGIGEPVAVKVSADSDAVGQSLAQLDLRAVTGASVLAIARESGVTVPGPGEELHADDVLAVAGTHEAVVAVRALVGPPVHAAHH